MSNERIDLTELEEQFKDGLNWDEMNTMELIVELKRCYDLIDKMQHSIVKNRGDCWDCDMPIDSCDARYCERQMLEDIELGTASE